MLLRELLNGLPSSNLPRVYQFPTIYSELPRVPFQASGPSRNLHDHLTALGAQQARLVSRVLWGLSVVKRPEHLPQQTRKVAGVEGIGVRPTLSVHDHVREASHM